MSRAKYEAKKRARYEKFKKRKKQKYGPIRPPISQEQTDDLGPLALLPGTWKGEVTGWNMIALPFATQPPPAGFNYRILMNQYAEELKFDFVATGVPNRGIRRNGGTTDADQFLVTLDYQQKIHQIAVDDFPESDKRGGLGPDEGAIHHEPGLFLHMTNENTNDLDIARLGTIPHGNSFLALGKSDEHAGPPQIPSLNGLPIGISQDVENSRYLGPYKHYVDNPFVGGPPPPPPGFPGFHPLDLNEILKFANNNVNIVKTTVLHFDSTVQKAGVVNIPFIEKQADAEVVQSTFWIQELADKDAKGNPKLRLQYSQVVMLDFFQIPGGAEGELIRWPHVSINTMEKVV